jgi:hypothetical protein
MKREDEYVVGKREMKDSTFLYYLISLINTKVKIILFYLIKEIKP